MQCYTETKSKIKINMNNKTGWGIVVAAIVLVVAGALIYMQWGDKDSAYVAKENGMEEGGEAATSTEPATSTDASNGAAAPAKLSYAAALKKYGANRIQFDTKCATEQNKLTFKAGTDVMFDNRAGVSRTITFGGTKYAIARYDYRVLRMTARSYPATVLVDCDKQQNVATITIQR